MIDYEVDIFDEMASIVYEEWPEAYVSGEHVERPASFPCVTIIETVNQVDQSREDSSGDENAAILSYTVNVYSNSQSGAKSQCRAIMSALDDRFRLYNMRRTFVRPVNNAADPTVYRLVARFLGVIDRFGTHYGRY